MPAHHQIAAIRRLAMLALVLAALLCGAAQVSAKVATPHGGNALSEFFSDYEQSTIAKTPVVQELPPEPPLCYYDLASGRGVWLSPDPIGEAGGINLYGYVGNDPVNYWDPLGLEDTLCVARDQTMKDNDDFKAMKKAAEEAGYKVITDASADDLQKAWSSSKPEDTIIYHTHGFPDGTIQYRYGGKLGQQPVTEIFDPSKGKAKDLKITSCNPDKVVSPEVKKEMKEEGVNVESLTTTPYSNGDTNRILNYRKMRDFFKSQK